jgi:CRP-like cAMP-binding protein
MSRRSERFDAEVFLRSSGAGRKLLMLSKTAAVFSQGDPADSVYYIHSGNVKLSVVSERGKEAVIAILGPRHFFGESSLTGRPVRPNTARAMTDCLLARVEERIMRQAIQSEPALSQVFTNYLLARNLRMEEDLIDQLFNSSEKRLARILLLLAEFDKETPRRVVPRISQETLAEMVGTTRSRVSFFMNKFRKSGYIDYKDALHVRSSLLNVLLRD